MDLYPDFAQEFREISRLLEPEQALLPVTLPQELLLSRLLMLSARFGDAEQAKLCQVAAAIELLEMAVELHYGEDRKARLTLITGDYYYAKALSLVAPLGDQRIILLASQAISDVAQSEEKLAVGDSGDDNREALSQRAALYRLSCHLGAHLAGVDRERTVMLRQVGVMVGQTILAKKRALGGKLLSPGVAGERATGVSSIIRGLHPEKRAKELEVLLEAVVREGSPLEGERSWS